MKRNEAEMITKKVVAILEKERIARKISKLQISNNTGISRTALTLIVDNKNSPTLRSLLMISSSIGVDITNVIKQAQSINDIESK